MNPDSNPEHSVGTSQRSAVRTRARGVFSGLKIRKKLIVLHTLFSLTLGVFLLIAMSPAMSKMIDGAEQDIAQTLVQSGVWNEGNTQNTDRHIRIREIDPALYGLGADHIDTLKEDPQLVFALDRDRFGAGVLWYSQDRATFMEVRAQSDRARSTVQLIYGLVIVTLFVGYAFVALSLEVMVLPFHVYTPIRALLDADHAVREQDSEHELVPEDLITKDELGEIMRSRNETVTQLRTHERELGKTLERLEAVALDLHTKNRLLETARKNLEGADRLASLGMMSAGIAHELNTPLAVVKGLVEQMDRTGELAPSQIKLLVRVVGRIETLSEGLLDFARVRTPRLESTKIHRVIEDAWMLIKLDRQSVLPGQRIEFVNTIDDSFELKCDASRMVQVFVNLIRNAVNAMGGMGGMDDHPGRIEVGCVVERRDDGDWAIISVHDNGPGIDPSMIDSMFEPFVSSRLDAKGTGLGLAVADGIVREHGGIVVPSNLGKKTDENGEGDSGGLRMGGAKFDIHLPIAPQVEM